MSIPVADLHCDLLSYLRRKAGRTENDPESQSSIPQMKQGGVKFQTLAVFAPTEPGSVSVGGREFDIFKKLHKPFPMIASIENGSVFAEEGEKLEIGLNRLEKMHREAGEILYISFTWNTENRFGGGHLAAKTGLKKDGETLLDFIDGKKICVDLSHTSDPMAHDILNYIDKKKLDVQPIASHSNFRSIVDISRNLPDGLAKEIIKRKGVIGITMLRTFIGKEPAGSGPPYRTWGKSRRGEVAIGSTIFAEIDRPPTMRSVLPFFFPEYNSSSCFPKVFDLMRPHISEDFIHRIAHKNFEVFFHENYGHLRQPNG